MIRVFGRLSLAVCVAMVAVVGTSISPGHGATVARNSAFAAPQYGAAGVSAAVAARSLNALAHKENASTSKSLTDVHFILNWLPNVEFAGLWMAQKFNWWQKAGIK